MLMQKMMGTPLAGQLLLTHLKIKKQKKYKEKRNMAEIDVQNDLQAVTEKMEALVDELNKVNAHREQLVGQVQNLQGVLMYLRGKDESSDEVQVTVEDAGSNVPPEVVEKAKEAIQGKINEGDKDS